MPQPGRAYAIYAFTIGLSALLLFALEPMVGKSLLPWFGGSSAVWATSLLFFTSALFAGYLYVFLLIRFAKERSALVHVGVVALCAVALIVSLLIWGSMYPPLDWVTEKGQPALNLLLVLSLSIGAPFFLLATTGPLLQYWYSATTREEPYHLYAISNAGSLIALLGYPFLIEPSYSLRLQENSWLLLFFLYALCCVSISIMFRRSGARAPEQAAASGRLPWTTYAIWTGLSALPAFMLVATTTEITQVVAPVPLLWVIPLSLYLLTLIVAFAGRGGSIFVPLVLLVTASLAFNYTPASWVDASPRILSYLALLFFAGLACHAKLYELRPAPARLPLYYLFVSFGGMIGTLFASMLAPLVFDDLWEFPLGLALCAAVGIALISERFFPRLLNLRYVFFVKAILIAGTAFLFTNMIFADDAVPSIHERNFYGTARVEFRPEITSLMHGTTLHGIQPVKSDYRYLPTSYYVPSSGIGRALIYEQGRRKGKDFKIAVIGLGTGSIASYCREGDEFVFYEIDPAIVDIARTHFTYLGHCKGSSIRLGDARIVMEKEGRDGDRGGYDIIAMDAFSDDTVPVHLITLQAIEMYNAHLRDRQGIIAVHISNRYLDLWPVIARIARQLNLTATVITDSPTDELGSATRWVLLSRDPEVFQAIEFANIAPWPAPQDAPLWTDDYSSALSALSLDIW